MRTQAVAGVVASLAVLTFGCSDSGEATENPDAEAPGFESCAYLEEQEVIEMTGLPLIEDQELTSSSICSFILDAGPTGVNVQVLTGRTPAEFTALLPSDAQTESVDAPGADQALVWSDSETVQAGLVRVGGSAARVTIVWDQPRADFAALTSMLETAADRLPEIGFEDVVPPGQATCDRVPIETLRATLELQELQAAPAGSSSSCALSDSASGINLLVDLPEGAAGQEQLNLEGRTTTIEGAEYEWVVEAVDGVGDGALWTQDPVSERSGELLALFGDQLVRVTSSANEPGDGIKIRAMATAQVAAGATGG